MEKKFIWIEETENENLEHMLLERQSFGMPYGYTVNKKIS